MAKVIKFSFDDNQESKDEVKEINTEKIEDEKEKIKKAVEEHILSNFAVKSILDMEIVYKINKADIGLIGEVAYFHKRRDGVFVADFIAKGYKNNDRYIVDSLAFSAGEPEFYKNIMNILKAKKAFPEL